MGQDGPAAAGEDSRAPGGNDMVWWQFRFPAADIAGALPEEDGSLPFRSALPLSYLMTTPAEGPRAQSPRRRSPEILLILGTDLAGKDHVANIVGDAAARAGIRVERRRGRFSARPDGRRTSEGKGRFKLCLEWLFLATLPLYCRLFPYLLTLLIRWDLWRFRPPAEASVIVVSHTALRLLAFALGHIFTRVEEIRLPAVVEGSLRALAAATRARTIVLDVDHQVRAARLQERLQRGAGDCFDRYMITDPERSERIEHFLVWLGITYFGAVRIENNDLSDSELLTCLARANILSPPVPSAPG